MSEAEDGGGSRNSEAIKPNRGVGDTGPGMVPDQSWRQERAAKAAERQQTIPGIDPAPMQYPRGLALRPTVARFAEMMESTLRDHDEDKGGQHEWRQSNIATLYSGVQAEVRELDTAICTTESHLVLQECIDVANTAMILADRALMVGTFSKPGEGIANDGNWAKHATSKDGGVGYPMRTPEFANVWNAFAQLCHSNSASHGFWPPEGRNHGELLALIHSEVSECLEATRHGNPRSTHIPEHSAMAEELADILIRVGDMAAGLGLDVGSAVMAKMAFNAARPHKHGKAF